MQVTRECSSIQGINIILKKALQYALGFKTKALFIYIIFWIILFNQACKFQSLC